MNEGGGETFKTDEEPYIPPLPNLDPPTSTPPRPTLLFLHTKSTRSFQRQQVLPLNLRPSALPLSKNQPTTQPYNMSSLIIKELIKFVKKKFAADKAAKAGEGEKKAEGERVSFPKRYLRQNQANLDPPPPNSKNPCRTRPSPRMDCPSRCQRKPILLR